MGHQLAKQLINKKKAPRNVRPNQLRGSSRKSRWTNQFNGFFTVNNSTDRREILFSGSTGEPGEQRKKNIEGSKRGLPNSHLIKENSEARKIPPQKGENPKTSTGKKGRETVYKKEREVCLRAKKPGWGPERKKKGFINIS